MEKEEQHDIHPYPSLAVDTLQLGWMCHLPLGGVVSFMQCRELELFAIPNQGNVDIASIGQHFVAVSRFDPKVLQLEVPVFLASESRTW
ncbi:hypothetical protein IMZ48_44375 [Candidatus Bathyarchaeota archaeon]|nr:hypothetical protein [Candidatus Bathyarchaeota archaeon]